VNALAISIIRTYVPIIVGGLVSWLLTAGIQLSADTQTGLIVALTGLITAAYYAGVRALETRFPAVGVLLGVAKSPDSYSKGSEPAVAAAGPVADLPQSEDVVLPDLTVEDEPVVK
jgi:hypothetical protein